MNRSSRVKRLIVVAVIGVIAVIVVLYIGMPLVMALAAVAPGYSTVPAPPDGFTDVRLTTADGVQLAAWYAAPENGAAIILVHGAGDGRESLHPYAIMLHEQGFGVLAVNMRGYGDSEGQINRLGWQGTIDVGAAVDFLRQQDDVQTIGALGLSMGGEILLGAASTYPEVQAIVAEGATYRSLDEYTALPMNQPLYRHFTHAVFTFWVSLLTGQGQPIPPLTESIRQAESTAFLFIAAGNEDDEIAYNTLFHDLAVDRSQLWVIPNAGHTAGFALVPDQYETQITAFFSDALL